MSGHKSSEMNQESVQDRGVLGQYAKSDIRYWQQSIFRQTYTRNGQTLVTKDWAMKIAHKGRRETFPLGTPNKAAAAARARRLRYCLRQRPRNMPGVLWEGAKTASQFRGPCGTHRLRRTKARFVPARARLRR